MSKTNKFFLELTNTAKETMVLEFDTYHTPIAFKWYTELQRIVSWSDDHIKERDRFYNLPGDKWNEATIVAKINECIDTINSYKQTIDITAIVNGGQEHFNKLHTYFEKMRGEIDSPTVFFSAAPPNIKSAIETYNIAIHRLESHLRSIAGIKPTPRLVVRVQNQKRIPLAMEDFDHFTVVTKFGEVYLNYCEVGKHFLELCADDGLEDIASERTIKPQRHYSASFVTHFSESDGVSTTANFNTWFSKNETKLNSLGYFRDDKTLSVGYLPVAILVNNMPEQELLNQIGRFDTVNRIYFSV